jgi:hypothetical protein
MNRYILIHRLTGPSVLLLLGVVALLHQAHWVRWSIFVPLLLILIGVLKLAERALLAGTPYPGAAYPGSAIPGSAIPGSAVPGSAYPGSVVPASTVPGTARPDAPVSGTAGAQPYAGSESTSLVPTETHDFGSGFGKGSDGGQL